MSLSRLNKKVVVIGGGSGNSTLLASFKNAFEQVTTIVNMVDNGGSTGRLRDELGVLPVGDLRQCLLALSELNEAELTTFKHRFEQGELAGFALGNLLIAAAEQTSGDILGALEQCSNILQVRGKVLPVTTENVNVHMELDGQIIEGQVNIALNEFDGAKKPHVFIEPDVHIPAAVSDAITDADIVVIAPGDMYSSILPVLSFGGLAEALQTTSAPIVLVTNLVNRKFQTNNFLLKDYVDIVERVIGEGTVQHLIYNNKLPDESFIQKYGRDGEALVPIDTSGLDGGNIALHGGTLISQTPMERAKHDPLMKLERNFVKHEADQVASLVMEILR